MLLVPAVAAGIVAFAVDGMVTRLGVVTSTEVKGMTTEEKLVWPRWVVLVLVRLALVTCWVAVLTGEGRAAEIRVAAIRKTNLKRSIS